MAPQLDPTEIEFTLKVANGFCTETDDVVYCLEEDCFYLYEHGVFKKIFTREMHNLVLTRKSLTKKMSLQGLKNVVDRIATIKQKHISDFNSNSYVNFENGLYDIYNHTFIPHSPTVLSTIRIPYKYNGDAACPLWEKTLKEILEGDKNKTKTLQEFFGYCLTREVKYEKALVMTGEGGTGKSTIMNTLKYMVGMENCSALSLRYFSDPQKTSVLKSKLINICTEVPKKIEDFESDFRKIVTGEEITISPKYVADYTITPYCKVVLAINEFPYIDDKTSAFYRRLLLLELKREFKEEEQNKDLKEMLLIELPGIFNWAIEGLKQLQARKTFVIDEYMKLHIESLKEMNNPTIQWAKEHIIPLKEEYIIKSEAYEQYKSWCEKNGYRPTGINKFAGDIYRIFSKFTDKDYRLASLGRPRIWNGLAFKTPENEIIAQREKENVDWTE